MSGKNYHTAPSSAYEEVISAFEETALQYKLQHYRSRYDGPFKTSRDANLHLELQRCRQRLAERLTARSHKLLPVQTTTSTTVADTGISAQVISDDLKNESLANKQ